jgi:hypothetical protein
VAVVGAEVPHQAPPPSARRLANEGRLGLAVGVGVAVVLAVAGPRGFAGLPPQPAHELAHAPHARPDELGAEAGGAQLPLDRPTLDAGVAALESRVEDDIRQHAAPQPVATAQQPGGVRG